ncbi:MAG: histidine phosphatase family protein [Candidatus Pacebacteria bacterium]|nr:histidine phosphatase family protein [Candidatus Paceibacterota bacterium]
MELFIARHAQTEENKAGIVIGGELHGTLSIEGIDQAKKLAWRLKDEKIDFIYSSDLKRAVDTTDEIAKFHPETPIVLLPTLRERKQGARSGMTFAEIADKKAKEINGPKVIYDGLETRNAIYERAKEILQKIKGKHLDGKILIVGHGGINRVLISLITEQELSSIERQHETGLNHFEINADGTHKVHLSNDTSHLK